MYIYVSMYIYIVYHIYIYTDKYMYIIYIIYNISQKFQNGRVTYFTMCSLKQPNGSDKSLLVLLN